MNSKVLLDCKRNVVVTRNASAKKGVDGEGISSSRLGGRITQKILIASFLIGAFSFVAPATVVRGEDAKAAADKSLPAGKIIAKVVCDKAGHSYACYLPKNYDGKKKCPIIYCFSPNARGKLFVEGFSSICEKHGWIVVGSNDSKNGPQQTEAIKAMWDDTQKRLSIDTNRIYVSGFSGGSRVATWFGSIHKAKGHVAIGGVYCHLPQLPRMSYFLICGTTDFNREEMEKAAKALKSRNVPTRIQVFQGGHTLPPKTITDTAIDWLESKAQAAKKKKKEEAEKK